jgi:hypothetical protein
VLICATPGPQWDDDRTGYAHGQEKTAQLLRNAQFLSVKLRVMCIFVE